MAAKSNEVHVDPEQTQKLLETMGKHGFADDPYLFTMWAFPWGEAKKPLAKWEKPRTWQCDEMYRIRDFIGENKIRISKGENPRIYRSATCSGRGPGKSALVSMLSLWHMSTHLGSSTNISANTETQLSTKTFAEIGKWRALCMTGYWFDQSVIKVSPKSWLLDALQKQSIGAGHYYILGATWSEDNPESFAGHHNEYGTMYVFDEASGIPKPMWDLADSGLTEAVLHRYFLAFSNPRHNTGPFFECFNENREYWYTRAIDTRDVDGPGIDKDHLNSVVARHGEDSDEARVEVKGEFPRQGDTQFISRQLVKDAQTRELHKGDDNAPLLMGVDPARYGDDSTVIYFRKGRDARSIPPIIMKHVDNMVVANKCMELIEQFDPDGVFIDAGAGSGIIDRLREMGIKVYEVNFGGASGKDEYSDHRTEMWAEIRDWLSGAMIPLPLGKGDSKGTDENDPGRKLEKDLTGPNYEYWGKEGKIKLESKEKMKKRSLPSPDHGDALAVTFSVKIARRDFNTSRGRRGARRRVKVKGVGCSGFSDS